MVRLVTKVADKISWKNILHVQVFKKNDKRTIYNCGLPRRQTRRLLHQAIQCNHFMTRDKLYDITGGTPGSPHHLFHRQPEWKLEIIKIVRWSQT